MSGAERHADVIVAGAGHNGLVSAASAKTMIRRFAKEDKQGKAVTVDEARS